MKIQCDVCSKAETTLLCCADDAALCFDCDQKIHAANKLAGKHQRVPLLSPSSSSDMPSCDICQEKVGYFFCLQDRALLCGNCDKSIHCTASHGLPHQRFLLTGVQVALQHYTTTNNNAATSMNDDRSNSNSSNYNNNINCMISNNGYKEQCTKGFTGAGNEGDEYKEQWMWSDVYDNAEFAQSYMISEPGSSN